MNNKTFLEEKEKLKEINNKVLEEEKLIEEELRKSDMNYTMEDIAKGEVLLTRVKKLENIKKIKNVPYFARMDFKEENRDLEKLYIGKISILDNKTAEPIIVDWRAPISNLYYEGKIGSAEYECLGKKIKGDILLKRQYIIEKKQLKKYIDINVTGNDELLQNALEEKADDRLKNIVATIQDEQNKIIMIIAPTKFFLNYISNILPDLGVNNVKQCTFEDFAYDVIGKKLKISDSNEKLVIIVNKEFDDINKGKIDIMIKEAKYKSSIKFKKIVDDYLLQIENNYIPKNDFYFKDYEIMSYNNINKLFKETYKMYNYNDRIKEIEKNLISELKKKSLLIIDDIRKKRSKELQNLTGENRIKVFDKYEKIIKLLEKDYKKIVKQYLNQISKKDCIQYYKEFIDGYLQNSDEVMIYLKKNTSNNLQKNEISFEDLAPIMYIQYKIFGIKEKCKIKHVVVDEAQDYGEFQFDILKQILNSNSMTILGDIAQGVHYYRGIENWKKFIDVEFKNVKTVYTTLNKTYRTTKEIMEVANNVINKLPEFEKEYIVLGEPVIDRKNSVNIKKNKNIDELISSINNRINEYLQNDYKSIAIIGKDMNECEEIEKKLRKTRKDIKLIKGKDSEYNSGISVIPSYLAKGLEFDCVIISNANEEKYTYSSLDIKLLYVTITRAMSKLDIFYIGEITGLLKNIVL